MSSVVGSAMTRTLMGALYSTVQYSTVQYSTVLVLVLVLVPAPVPVQYSTVQYITVLYCERCSMRRAAGSGRGLRFIVR